MITLRNEADFNQLTKVPLGEVIEWINSNLQIEDVFDKEKVAELVEKINKNASR